jgi:uncharacterized protein YjiS (DUF1127 family)
VSSGRIRVVFHHRKDLGAIAFRGGKIMHKNQSLVEVSLNDGIHELVGRFGPWRTALAVLFVAWRQRQSRNAASALSPRMLEDIGLPADEVQRLPSRMSLWDIRL